MGMSAQYKDPQAFCFLSHLCHEKARGDIMEIQLKVYDLQRELDDERENRRKDREKHESVVQGLTSSIESSARREAQLGPGCILAFCNFQTFFFWCSAFAIPG